MTPCNCILCISRSVVSAIKLRHNLKIKTQTVISFLYLIFIFILKLQERYKLRNCVGKQDSLKLSKESKGAISINIKILISGNVWQITSDNVDVTGLPTT